MKKLWLIIIALFLIGLPVQASEMHGGGSSTSINTGTTGVMNCVSVDGAGNCLNFSINTSLQPILTCTTGYPVLGTGQCGSGILGTGAYAASYTSNASLAALAGIIITVDGLGNVTFPGTVSSTQVDTKRVAYFQTNTTLFPDVSSYGFAFVVADSETILCGGGNLLCSDTYYTGTTVTLSTACPLSASKTIYDGDCTGSSCSLAMDVIHSVGVACISGVTHGGVTMRGGTW